jgi:hypothetical protein
MHCRLCRSADTARLGDFSVAEIDGYPLSGLVEPWRCAACGLVFHRIPPRNDYEVYYRRFNKHHARSADARRLDAAYFSSCLDQLEIADAGASVLDYGSGDRLFTEVCAGRGLHNVFSYDVHLDFPQRKFDVVVTAHTFEHVVPIAEDFARMASLVEDDGRLLFAVPDAQAYGEHYCGPYGWLDLEHINHFTTSSVLALFAQTGLELLSLRRGGREVRPGLIYPEVRAVARPARPGTGTQGALPAYLDRSQRDLAVLSEAFARFVADSRFSDVFLWGCGITARRLLARVADRRLRVCDIDARLHGLRIGEHTIESPDAVPNAPTTGVFVAAVNQDAIAASIAARLPLARIVKVDFGR